MSVSSHHRSILRTVKTYEKLLKRSSDERFTETPPQGGWSYAEVYSHIFASNLLCITAMERCIEGKAIESRGSIPFLYRLVFFFGRFPPGTRFRVPDKLKEQVKKISRDEAMDLMDTFRQRVEYITPLVHKASPTQKVKHPRLGLLNARKWLRFIDIHTRHHEKQLGRISKSFAGK